MDFLELCKARFSCRGFSSKAISLQDIRYIQECARLSPSARNCQPYTVIQIEGSALASSVPALQIEGANPWASSARLLWVIVGEESIASRDYTDFDSGILSATICYAAAERNVGTCIVGKYNEAMLQNALGLSSQKKIVMVIAAGYPAANPRNARKKSVEELFGDKYDR